MSDGENYKLYKTFAGAPRTVRGRPSYISSDPKGQKILYCNGNSIFIRDIDDPTDCDVYTQHSKETTCALFSPSGYYIASGDTSGKIRIWDTINKEHILKYEYSLLGGPIKDIAWSEDSKRIAVCGEGNESSAKVINWDTGTTCGMLTGPVKSCNNIAIKQTRPYRLVLVSEDYSSCVYEGPPFKFIGQYHEHVNFVNCARFSPDGQKFATAGADGKCFIHDGKTGKPIGELNEPAGRIHKAGIYGICWSPDNKYLMSASADKTVKIWCMDENYFSSNKEAVNFEMGCEIDDMQVGCVWPGDKLISISLNGNINYLDVETKKTTKIVKGHTKAIVASCLSEDRKTLFTSSFDGLIYYWDLSTGVGELVGGSGHRNQVQNMSCVGSTIVTCGMDDTVRYLDVAEKKFIENKVVKMESQPQRIAAGSRGMSVVACNGVLVLVRDERVDQVYKCRYEPSCVAISSTLGKVALGTEDSKVILYDIEGDKLKESGSIPTNGKVTDLKFSPDEKSLAMCTGNKQVKVVSTSDYESEPCPLNTVSHAVKVNNIAWSPNSKHVASCGTDGAVFVWNVERAEKIINMRGAHSQSVDVTTVQFSTDDTLITTGRQDCSVRMWKLCLE